MMIHSTMLVQLALLDFWTAFCCLEHSKQNVFCKLDPFLLLGEKKCEISEETDVFCLECHEDGQPDRTPSP
jgi:hypothetical protein